MVIGGWGDIPNMMILCFRVTITLYKTLQKHSMNSIWNNRLVCVLRRNNLMKCLRCTIREGWPSKLMFGGREWHYSRNPYWNHWRLSFMMRLPSDNSSHESNKKQEYHNQLSSVEPFPANNPIKSTQNHRMMKRVCWRWNISTVLISTSRHTPNQDPNPNGNKPFKTKNIGFWSNLTILKLHNAPTNSNFTLTEGKTSSIWKTNCQRWSMCQ